MSEMVSPEAAAFLTLMAEETVLPSDWEVSGLWLAQAQALAQFLADSRARLTLDDAAMLLGLGGLLITMAQREREASAEVGRFLRGEGGAA